MGMLLKSKKAPRPEPIKAPPSAQDIMDVIDELAGVQTIIAKGPNGKKRRVVQRLPRTPQEQAFFRQGEQLMSRAIKNIQQLQKYDPSSVVDFKPVVQAFANLNQEQERDLAQIADFGNIEQDVANFKQMQSNLLEDQFMRQRNQLETDLSRQGRSRGSYGAEVRARNDYYENLARQQNEINATQYGEDLAAQRLNRNLTAYEARQRGRENRLNAAQTEYGLRQQQLQDLENRRQFAINENMNQFGLGANLTGQDLARAMSSRAPELANQTFALQNADQLARYNADVNRQQIDYGNQLSRYNSRAPSFGEAVGSAGGTLLGASLTAPSGSIAGRIGNKLFGKWV